MEVKNCLSCLLSQEKPLNKSLQRGEDSQFDQVSSPPSGAAFTLSHIRSTLKLELCFESRSSQFPLIIFADVSPAADQLHEFPGRVLPAVHPQDSVRLVQETERPGGRVARVPTQSQHQVEKVRGRKSLTC